MTTYKELLKQREALEAQISDARQRELSDAVSRVRGLIEEFGLTANDVFPPARGRGPSSGKGGKVAAKYRDPATGATWTGRGKAPRWIAGTTDRSAFAI
ncbi:H-NS histone family protein [Xylophilus rhododendri]|uniref:H-NS histone family protein n=1 Tax=Xylophilus rhododendri TaxID=2697032 RepID=A0A857J4W4_9BURK|nr:H-NS histone family protein [Xylophilus rhododendri]QHI98071.1 H-NS histone family protein [Xylophilus rhododendri]